MRTVEEIEAEIYKVENAEMGAVKKQERCAKRIDELEAELKTAETEAEK